MRQVECVHRFPEKRGDTVLQIRMSGGNGCGVQEEATDVVFLLRDERECGAEGELERKIKISAAQWIKGRTPKVPLFFKKGWTTEPTRKWCLTVALSVVVDTLRITQKIFEWMKRPSNFYNSQKSHVKVTYMSFSFIQYGPSRSYRVNHWDAKNPK